jgi:arylsulfatase
MERKQPSNLEELYKVNDLELFDLEADPQETVNLAADRDKNGRLVAKMSDKLEAAIAAEIGKDDGREMPDLPHVNWTIDRPDL